MAHLRRLVSLRSHLSTSYGFVSELLIGGHSVLGRGSCSSFVHQSTSLFDTSASKSSAAADNFPSSPPLPELSLSTYPYSLAIQTRWKDNDVYGHVNNVQYYSYFDTVINHFLIKKAGLDIEKGAVIGVAVESLCQYHASISYPEIITAALRVGKLGRSSVRWEIGIFSEHNSVTPVATGRFIHVFVDRITRKPVAIPDAMGTAIQTLLVK